jgi:RND family efflux transporter MFP subunit
VAVEIVPVRKTTMQAIGRFTGSLRPNSMFVVAPKVGGRLEKLTVDVGDEVRSGQLIAQLDDDEYAQQVEQARAELAVGKANVAETKSALELAKRELKRVTALHEKKMASDSERDEVAARYAAAEAKQKVALAEVTRREAALRAAEVRLSYTRIRVSWEDEKASRVVGERYVDEGEMLRANDSIVSILDNSVMVATIDVIERDYTKLSVGQQATVTTDAFPGREFTGKIVRIAPLLKETSRQARVDIDIQNEKQELKPGMYVRVRIEFDRHENAVIVPFAALARRDGRQGVFVVDKDGTKARFVPITAGIIEGDLVEVLDPPLSGNVVTMGHHLLEDGGGIRLPGAPSDRQGEKDSGKGGRR